MLKKYQKPLDKEKKMIYTMRTLEADLRERRQQQAQRSEYLTLDS